MAATVLYRAWCQHALFLWYCHMLFSLFWLFPSPHVSILGLSHWASSLGLCANRWCLLNISVNYCRHKSSSCWAVASPFPLFSFFFLITRYTLATHAPTPMNAHAQTLFLWASSKTEHNKFWDWQSHHRRLAVNGTSPSIESTTPLNSRIYGKSNSEPKVLPSLL